MRYPYEPLLVFLLSRKRSVNQTLEQYQLPPVGDIWLAENSAKLRTSGPSSLKAFLDDGGDVVGHEEILAWAKERGIYELWNMQAEFSGQFSPHLDLAYRVFSQLETRTSLNLLLLSAAEPDEVLEAFNEVHEMALTAEAVGYYESIFWAWRALSQSDWTRLIQTLPTKQERHDLAFALGRPSYEEARDHLALKVQVSPEEILQQIATKSFMNWRRAMEQPDPTQANVEYWQSAAQKAATDLDRVRRTNAEDEDVLKSGGFQNLFAVVPARSSHPTVADLQGEVSEPQKKLTEE